MTSLGSGFIIREDGIIVTARHVINNAEDVMVRLADKDVYAAEVIDSDQDADIAIMKIQANRPLPALRLGSLDLIQAGEWVIAIGNPLLFIILNNCSTEYLG